MHTCLLCEVYKISIKEFLPSASSNNQHKSTAKIQAACNQLGSTRPSVSDWSFNSAIIDNSFLPPLPTLTPPSEDPMASYSFMAPMSHSHSGFYHGTSVASQSSTRPSNQVYSAHSAANILPSSHTNSTMSVMTKGGSGGPQAFQPSLHD